MNFARVILQCRYIRFSRRQLRVADYRRNRIFELMSDAGRHLSERSEVLFQFDSIVQFDNFRQIGKKTDCPFDIAR